jgi:hypothetical protein
MELVGALVVGLIVTVVGGLLVLYVWHKVFKQPETAPEPTPRTDDDEAMRLLKVMREQIRDKPGYTVYAGPAAESLGIEVDSHEYDRRLHDLVQAGYLEPSNRPALTAKGMYEITFDGIDAADSH